MPKYPEWMFRKFSFRFLHGVRGKAILHIQVLAACRNTEYAATLTLKRRMVVLRFKVRVASLNTGTQSGFLV